MRRTVNRMVGSICAVAAISLGLCTWCLAERKLPLDKGTADALEKRMPSDLAKRQSSYMQLVADRRQMIGDLLVLIGEYKDETDQHIGSSRICFAMRTLGLLRAENAVGPLMDMIDFRFEGERISMREPEDTEVIRALASIGKPSSKLAVEYLAKDKSTVRAPMYLRVIHLVEGPEVGKFMLEQAVKQEKDAEKKARLEKALPLFADAGKVVQ